MLLLHASYTAGQGELPAQGCYYALGERGKPAEQVANEALEALLGFIDTDATLDHYLADQLLLPLAFASGPSTFRTARVSHHLLTNAQVIQIFTGAQVTADAEIGISGTVQVYTSRGFDPSIAMSWNNPGSDISTPTRTIIHLDLDAFFCAVEELHNPRLAGRAFAVGGRPEQRGVVASCSYPARNKASTRRCRWRRRLSFALG